MDIYENPCCPLFKKYNFGKGISAMSYTAEAIFDQVEKEVLDRVHLKMNLLYRNEEDAIESLFRCYANILRDLRSGKIKKPNAGAIYQTANEGLRGLPHCLRWIRQCCPSTLIVPTSKGDLAYAEALELLRWGVQYDPIFGEHSAYRGNLARFELDESAKIIEFPPTYDVSHHFFCSQEEAKKADDRRRSNACPENELSQLSKLWFDSLQITNCGLHFEDLTMRKSGAIDIATKWMEKTCLPELEGETKLHGYTVADLRMVLASIYVYSLFVTKLEDITNNQPQFSFMLEPHILSGKKNEIVSRFASLSGVNETNVDAIISILTFDHSNEHMTLAQQPFVCSKNNRMFLLPRLIMAISLSLPKMYISAINKSKDGRNVYADLINDIENKGVQAVYSDLKKILRGDIQIAIQKKYSLDESKYIKPDIVILSNQNEVLIIDVKYAIPPFGPLDIRYDIAEMDEWKQKMSLYVEAFQNHPNILKQHFNRINVTTENVYGLILLRWPFPIPVDFQTPICAVDWPSLKQYLKNANPESVSEIFNWANKRPDFPILQNLKWVPKEIKVRDWTYKYYVLATPDTTHK
jgi:hypothetical protein